MRTSPSKQYVDQAVKNVTRSGDTFTATRLDNSTFTFAQRGLGCDLIGQTNSTSATRIGAMNDKYALYLVCVTYKGWRLLESNLIPPPLLMSSTQSLPSECTYAVEPNVYAASVYSNGSSIYAYVKNSTYCTVNVYGLY